MKKVAIVTGIYAFITMGWLLASCDSNRRDEGEKLAETEEQAQARTEDAYQQLAEAETKSDVEDIRDDLKKMDEKLTKEQQNYYQRMQKQHQDITRRLEKLNGQIASADATKKQRLTTNRDTLIHEKDLLEANMLEMQKPMNDDEWRTVESKLKQLIAAIDTELEKNFD
ncbi:hypothetical protein GCM10027275_25970 [Rhabdobacter roseus]|uniref:Succinate dehydrogenase/fumarate reductase flavoprotein subunit n=1 Tax=Rhabdobacter roseus TaxID=1655419 RepID=A0A840TMC4_9BACT|nr:hypothetical protein [Rhabdobacter roseus]MBB5284544.1 succinate dehydrogenase/fumarate reductase flavoprotein subunit [Rhabdobacter roseus]